MTKIYETAKEAADAIGVTQETISNWVKSGRLKPDLERRDGKDRLRIRREDLIAASRETMFETEPEAPQSLQMGFDSDPQDLKRDALSLEILWPDEGRSETYGLGVFEGFSRLRVLTYSVSLPRILQLLTTNDYDYAEIVFGSEEIARETDAAKVLFLQQAIESELATGYMGIGGIGDPSAERLMEWQASRRARFHVVGGGVVHSKVYLLDKPGLRRVLVGSANLSKPGLSGRQGEVLVAYDNHQFMWDSLERKYQAVLSLSTDIQIAAEVKPAHLVKAEDLPAPRKGLRDNTDITILKFDQSDDLPGDPVRVAARATEIESILGEDARSYIKPARNGDSSILLRANIKKITYAAAPKPAANPVQLPTLEYMNGRFIHNGKPIERPQESGGIDSDASLIKRFIDKFREFGDGSDTLQRHYFALMGWLYFSPFIPHLSRLLYRDGVPAPSKTVQNMAIAYGQSNCGKSALIRFLYTSMFGPPKTFANKEFTQRSFSGLAREVGILPLVFEDVAPSRFAGRGANIAGELIAKHYDQLVSQTSRYPCSIVSANAESSGFANEVRNRAFLVYTPKGIASDDSETARRLDSEVKPWFNLIGQDFYSEYLHRMSEKVRSIEYLDSFDYLRESTGLIVDLLRETPLEHEDMPTWARPMDSKEFNSIAWQLKHRQMMDLLSARRFTPDYPPKPGMWTVSEADSPGDRIIVGVESVRDIRNDKEIQDHWIDLERFRISGDSIPLIRREVEESIRRSFPDWELPIPSKGIVGRIKRWLKR